MQSDDDSRERESMLSIYSALFTYHSDNEKNNDILKSALRTSKSLGQLLSNMQDGMRSYFDELSSQKHFIGIQQVLVEEINNSDSKICDPHNDGQFLPVQGGSERTYQ